MSSVSTPAKKPRTTRVLIDGDPLPFSVAEWLDAVRRHPDTWVKFPRAVHGDSIAAKIKKGQSFRTTKGEFEMRERTAGKGPRMVWMFVRYVGPRGPGVDWLREPTEAAKSSIVFEEPPAPMSARSPYRAWLEKVRRHPGVWVKYPNAHTAAAHHIRNGTCYGVKPGEFDAVSRRTDAWTDGTCDLYAMCLDVDARAVRHDMDKPWLERSLPVTSDDLVFENPPALHKRTDSPGGLKAGRSPITTWLDRTVRPLKGEWAQYPGPFQSQVPSMIRDGKLYSAREGEFETRVELERQVDGTTQKLLWARVKPGFVEPGKPAEPAPPATFDRWLQPVTADNMDELLPASEILPPTDDTAADVADTDDQPLADVLPMELARRVDDEPAPPETTTQISSDELAAAADELNRWTELSPQEQYEQRQPDEIEYFTKQLDLLDDDGQFTTDRDDVDEFARSLPPRLRRPYLQGRLDEAKKPFEPDEPTDEPAMVDDDDDDDDTTEDF